MGKTMEVVFGIVMLPIMIAFSIVSFGLFVRFSLWFSRLVTGW